MLNLQYLYRGTTEGWRGNKVLQEKRITCTTTDPFVATLFAIKCRDNGRAIILAARRGLFLEMTASPNYFSVQESAVNLQVSPEEFARKAKMTVDVDRAIEILRTLGFHGIPVRLRGPAALHLEIAETHAAGVRLTQELIRQFNLHMIETNP